MRETQGTEVDSWKEGCNWNCCQQDRRTCVNGKPWVIIIICLYGTNGYYTCGQYSTGSGEVFAFHGSAFYVKSLRESSTWNTGHVNLFGMKGYTHNNLTLREFYNKNQCTQYPCSSKLRICWHFYCIALFYDVLYVYIFCLYQHNNKEINHPEFFIRRTAKSDTRI